jgi:hypothetical protein
LCRVTLKVGEIFVFLVDGRVEHRDCPSVVCQVCHRGVLPGRRIRRLEDTVIHEYCWLRRLKARQTA